MIDSNATTSTTNRHHDERIVWAHCRKKPDFIIVGGRPNEYRFAAMLILGLLGLDWKTHPDGMRLTIPLGLRRIINSNYHPFQTIPKSDRWHIRERQNRFTAWQYGVARTTWKAGNMNLNKLFCYLDMQRQDEKKLEKFYAEERLNAALAEHHFEYKHFRNMLDKAHILLDNVVLSQLAIYEPRTFQSLVALAKEMAIKDGRRIIPDDEFKFEVDLDDSLFGEPYPKRVQLRKGPAENYVQKPRQLDPSEY